MVFLEAFRPGDEPEVWGSAGAVIDGGETFLKIGGDLPLYTPEERGTGSSGRRRGKPKAPTGFGDGGLY